MLAPLSPVVASAKTAAVTPDTDSLNVTVNETLEAVVGLAPARTIDCTTGGVRSIVNVWTVGEPGMMLLPSESVIVASAVMSSPSVPSDGLDTVTSRLSKLAATTDVIEAPAAPGPVSRKSATSQL